MNEKAGPLWVEMTGKDRMTIPFYLDLGTTCEKKVNIDLTDYFLDHPPEELPEIVERLEKLTRTVKRKMKSSGLEDRMAVDFIAIGQRIAKCLHAQNIHRVRDLVRLREGDVLKIPGIGKRHLHEINAGLKTYGLWLDMTIDEIEEYEDRDSGKKL
jgi:hypothetical protein